MSFLHIVSHCWKYSRVMAYQLSSLHCHECSGRVLLEICHSEEDGPTAEMISYFRQRSLSGVNVEIMPHPMPLAMLLNRSIGRNMAAKQCEADVMMFADCDLYFGEGAIDAIASVPTDPNDEKYSPLYYSQEVLISRTHSIGDRYSDRVSSPAMVYIDPCDFVQKRETKAIGGNQIVPGDVARRMGYCDGQPRQLREVSNGKWQVTRGDVCFRRILGTSGSPFEVPNLYRIRQSVQGEVDTRQN